MALRSCAGLRIDQATNDNAAAPHGVPCIRQQTLGEEEQKGEHVGHFSVVYGYINGPGDYADENRASIDALPADDTWPPLTRDLFAVPSQGHFYWEQLITFGTIYNGVERAWEEWLGKFEALLRTMYWYEARVHLETDSWGTYHYVWTSLSPIAGKSSGPELPVQKWTFSGGPRSAIRESYGTPSI
jgi:hypothetical protein